MNSREFILDTVVSYHPDAVFITSTGYISRAMYNLYPDNKNIFYMQGSMGLAPCIGLGMAASTDKEIVVISGDAALLMHLGITHTIAEQELKNLYPAILQKSFDFEFILYFLFLVYQFIIHGQFIDLI